MTVVNTYFENGITFFTNLIYTAIRYAVSSGDVAPFVGHNAILRWSAIQQVSFFDEDGYEKFWSESHVSEDFDMSLRLQVNGYIIRLAAWAGEGFKEGVSLTVYDELARWEKYAYGCNELLFHPIRTSSVAIITLFQELTAHRILDRPWSLHATVSQILLQQHSLHLKSHNHLLHRHILRHRRCLDHDHGKLLCYRLVQRLSR
jgi:hypothetical protein